MLAVTYLGVAFPNYTCSGAVCAAADTPTDFLFRTIQTQVNQLSAAVGITPIDVDGALGGQTSNAVHAIAAWLPTHNISMTPLSILSTFTGNVESMASDAEALSAELALVIQQLGAAGYPIASQAGDVTPVMGLSAGKKVALGLVTLAILGGTIAIVTRRAGH